MRQKQDKIYLFFPGLKSEPNTVEEELMMKMQTLTILMKEMPNLIRNLNDSMEHIQQRLNRIWREELLCREKSLLDVCIERISTSVD